MHASKFDELTKAVATAPSRRHALKVIVATSIGGLFGLTGIGTAFGRHRAETNLPSGPTGNSNCAKFCAAVFGPNTSAAGQCTSQGAHGTGLCHQCPNTKPEKICCVRLGSGYCSGSAPASCCTNIQTCLTGFCCLTANICGSTCLSSPCDANQCLHCNSTSGSCEGCP